MPSRDSNNGSIGFKENRRTRVAMAGIMGAILITGISIPLLTSSMSKSEPAAPIQEDHGTLEIEEPLKSIRALDNSRYVISYDQDNSHVFATSWAKDVELKVGDTPTVKKYHSKEGEAPFYVVVVTQKQYDNLGEYGDTAS